VTHGGREVQGKKTKKKGASIFGMEFWARPVPPDTEVTGRGQKEEKRAVNQTK